MDAFEFLALKEEVDKLKARHEASHDDPSMSFEQRLALAEEYTTKYKELERIALENTSEYREF